MVDVAATYLETLPGEPADDHTVVMVHVNAEALDVPAGTSVDSGTCYVEGHGPIEPATAERLLCTARVQGVLVGRGGKVLSLGRTKASRDPAVTHGAKGPRQGHLLFPRLPRAAHHIIAWSHGAPTDLHTPPVPKPSLTACGQLHRICLLCRKSDVRPRLLALEDERQRKAHCAHREKDD